jgi:hypothetical protein
MVMQPKKTGDIQICVYLRSPNAAYIHDHFSTPFTNEVLENFGIRESYSFADGFFKVSSGLDRRGRSS